jgi:hypothetical protein
MLSQIIHPNQLDLSKITFSTTKVRQNGSKSFYPLLDGRRFYLILPSLKTTFGVSQFKPNNPFDVRLNLDEKHSELHQTLMDFDAFLVQEASKPENCNLWLGSAKTKPFSQEVVASKYHPLVNFPHLKDTKDVDTRYPPFIRVKINQQFGQKDNFSTEFFDPNKQPLIVHLDNIKQVIGPHTNIGCLVSFEMYSCITGFGVSLSATQIRVYGSEKPIGHCLLNDNDNEIDEDKIIN